MITIIQENDKKEKHQSYECRMDFETNFYDFWYWKNTKESVDDFKKWILKWKQEFDEAFNKINFEELYKYDWEKDRELNI